MVGILESHSVSPQGLFLIVFHLSLKIFLYIVQWALFKVIASVFPYHNASNICYLGLGELLYMCIAFFTLQDNVPGT